MILQFINALYLLVAVAMIGFILMQRGAGAAAGSGFGAGASATVFGARGASSFLSKATKWLAVVFFALSLGMAMYASQRARVPQDAGLGVMGAATEQPAPSPGGEVPAADSSAEAPAAAESAVPAPSDDAVEESQPASPDRASQESDPAPDADGG